MQQFPEQDVPVYHFNLSNSKREEDRQGTELADAGEARRQAVMFAGEHLRDNPDSVWNGTAFEVEVTDNEGRKLFAVRVEAHEA